MSWLVCDLCPTLHHHRLTWSFTEVPTFLVAGHETTRCVGDTFLFAIIANLSCSTSTTWALYALCNDIAVQNKLREELLEVTTDNPTMDELNALPYLDAVVRETLRVHAPVSSTLRVAVKDDTIPLSTPVTDKYGKVHEYLE